jgi:hypothetical protein
VLPRTANTLAHLPAPANNEVTPPPTCSSLLFLSHPSSISSTASCSMAPKSPQHTQQQQQQQAGYDDILPEAPPAFPQPVSSLPRNSNTIMPFLPPIATAPVRPSDCLQGMLPTSSSGLMAQQQQQQQQQRQQHSWGMVSAMRCRLLLMLCLTTTRQYQQ